MKKILLATLLASAFMTPAMAQTASEAPEASPLTANIGLFSSYRFRGIDQTFGKPAVQGGVDYAHSSGLYVGNWNSNVKSGAGFPDGSLEMDFYGGYKTTFGDFGLDVGGILYYYPGSKARTLDAKANGGAVKNKELYVGGSWKFLSLKYSYSIDDYFSMRAGMPTDRPARVPAARATSIFRPTMTLATVGASTATSATCTPKTCARAATATGRSG